MVAHTVLLGTHFAWGKLVLPIARTSLSITSTVVHSLTHLHGLIIALSLLHIWQSILLSCLLYTRVIVKYHIWVILLIYACWSTPVHHCCWVVFSQTICHVKGLVTCFRVNWHVSFKAWGKSSYLRGWWLTLSDAHACLILLSVKRINGAVLIVYIITLILHLLLVAGGERVALSVSKRVVGASMFVLLLIVVCYHIWKTCLGSWFGALCVNFANLFQVLFGLRISVWYDASSVVVVACFRLTLWILTVLILSKTICHCLVHHYFPWSLYFLQASEVDVGEIRCTIQVPLFVSCYLFKDIVPTSFTFLLFQK